MKKSKELLIYSIALLFIAICEFFILLLDIRAGDYAMVTHEDALIQALTNGIIVVVLACSCISILVGGYLGIKGWLESRKPSGGSLHIVIAKIIAILNVILFIIFLLSMIGSTDLGDDIYTLATCGVDTILMFSYLGAAKAVKKGAE